MISLTNITKYYTSKKKKEIQALSQVNLSLPKTGFVIVVGPSGSGKTTLLNLLGLIDTPTFGSVDYEGVSLHSASQKDAFRSHFIGFVFQQSFFINHLTIYENLLLEQRVQGIIDKDRIMEALDLVGLQDYAQSYPSELSSGEIQRVSLARAVAKESLLILCDEPTGNLDNQNALQIMDYLKHLSKEKLIFCVTHNESFIPHYADRVIRLNKGKIESDVVVHDKPIAETNMNTDVKKTKFPLGIAFSLFFQTLKQQAVYLIFLTLLIASLTLITLGIKSFANYNYHDAFVQTLKDQEEYVIPLLFYQDRLSVFYGPNPANELLGEPLISRLESEIAERLPLYRSYYLNKTLQDFTQIPIIEPGKYLTNYRSIHFTDMVIVPEFSTFHLPLRYGNYPQNANEILIYDYMVQMMLDSNGFESMHYMEDFAGYTLTDQDTGTDLVISGILKSHYERYSYTDNHDFYDFEQIYLTRLQSVYGLPGLLHHLDVDSDYLSIAGASLNIDLSGNSTPFHFTKLSLKESMDDYTMIHYSNAQGGAGLYLSNHKLAYLLNVDVSDIDADFIETMELAGIRPHILSQLNHSIEKPRTVSSVLYAVQGIYEADALDTRTLLFAKNEEQVHPLKRAHSLRFMYLALSLDWDKNSEVLRELHMPYKPLSFYTENPHYYADGFGEATFYSFLFSEPQKMIYGFKDIAYMLLITFVALSAITVYFISNAVIKQQRHTFGVLRLIGVGSKHLSYIIIASMILTTLIGYALGALLSPYVLTTMNAMLNQYLITPLSFLSLKPFDYFLIFGIVLFGVFVALVYPMYRIYTQTPIKLMKQSIQ